MVYRTRQIQIKKGHRLFAFCKDITYNAARLYNRANYICRQYATGIRNTEEGKTIHENQHEVMDLVNRYTRDTKYQPGGKWLSYGTLDFLLKSSKDKDYYALPSQVNQQMLRQLLQDYKSFFEALKAYQNDRKIFLGRPRMPRYRGEFATAILTNQVCVLKEGRYLKFPKCKTLLNIGTVRGRLKSVRIKPVHDIFVVEAVMEVEADEISEKNRTELLTGEVLKNADMNVRAMAIDIGLNNLCAVTNNFGERPFLVNGRELKSINRYFNKEYGRLKSAAELCNKQKTTKRIKRICRKRENLIKDRMHKISRYIAEYAAKNDVEVVVVGHNKLQKQKADMGRTANQNFVQIPFEKLIWMLRYKLEEKGIVLIETEESYTSKADFLALDEMPVYVEGDEAVYAFSGKRVKRGIYRHFDGTESNADINGAANIMRKVFPNAPKGRWDRGLLDSPYKAKIAA